MELSVEALGERIRQKVNILFERGDLDGSARNALLDTLSPPAPEVDEATVWTRKVLMARAGGFSSDTEWQSAAVCQAIAELIVSKDGEIERLAGINSQLVAEHNAMNQDGARLESELAALRAENERLIATYVKYVAFDQPEAAERNPAEPAKTYDPGPWPGDPDHHETLPAEPWSIRGAGYDPNCEACKGSKFTCDEHFVKPDTDGSRSGGMQPGTNAGAVEVTQADKELWETVWDRGCENEPLEIAKYRTEAEARGRLEALEEIKKWLRSPEGKGSDAGIDYADGFADQIERMMTGGK